MKRTSLLLLFILFVASFLRFYHIADIPGSLNPDEASLGYTSYSLLLTGADEHGHILPLALQSFGDGKLPGYSYVGVIPVALFGLSEFSTRMPSVIAGILGVILIYYISKLLFKRESAALLSALFFALSPWSIYFSRAAYEVNVATTLFLGGLLLLLKYYDSQKRETKILILSIMLFAATMFTYHSYILFTPIFFFLLFFASRKNIKLHYGVVVTVLVFVAIVGVSYATVFLGNSQKSSSLYIFNDKNILYSRVEKLRGDSATKIFLLDRLLYTKYAGVSYQFAQNYINSFSPPFLFDKGGEKLVHNLGDFGNLYLFGALLLLSGFAGLFWNRERGIKILALWLLLAPLPSSITRDSPNSTRLFMLMPLFVLVEGYGAFWLLTALKRKSAVNLGLTCALSVLFILNVVYFLDDYFIHFNMQRVRFWHYGYKQAVELAKARPDYKVVMRGPENFPYIYFLFYNRYDPVKFQREVQYYPLTDEGLLYVKSFGKYSFPNHIAYEHLNPKTLYIDDTKLGDKKTSILFPNGDIALGYLINE